MAESLAGERNDITVIDTEPARLRALQDRLDLRGVAGGPLVLHSLAEIPKPIPGIDMRIVPIFRQDKALPAINSATRGSGMRTVLSRPKHLRTWPDSIQWASLGTIVADR